MNSKTNILHQEIKAFIRKFYLDRLLRGLLLWVMVFIPTVLLAITIVNLIEVSTALRTALFYTYLFFHLSTLVLWVGIPLSKYFFIGNIISEEKAAKLIGDFFPQIQDKLLNVLQLDREAHFQNNSFLIASVQQKTKEVSRFNFTEAVNLNENLKRARIPFFISVAFLAVFFIWPNFVKQGAQQILFYNSTPPAKKAPFQFSLVSDTLDVIEGDDITVKTELKGSQIPSQVFIEYENASFTMQEKNKNSFSYTFKDVRNDQSFKFEALGYFSPLYHINVLPAPKISRFSAQVDYPDYTGIKDESFKNQGDLTLPEGSCVSWRMMTSSVDKLNFKLKDTLISAANNLQNFDISQCFLNEQNYYVIYGNDLVGNDYDTIPYSIEIIKDAYPTINVSKEEDSTSQFQTFFTGVVSDDYGLNNVSFHYKIGDQDKWQSKGVSAKGSFTNQKFYYAIDTREFQLKKGQSLQYYFRVSDNDGVNGSKSSQSSIYSYNVPTDKAMNEQREKQTEKTKKSIEDLKKKSKKIQKDIQSFRKDLLNKKNAGWKDKQKLEEITNQKKNLQQQLKEMLNQQKKNNEFVNEYNKYSEETLKKQEQIQKIMDNLMDEEMKKLMDELNKMLEEQVDKEKLDELLKKSEFKEEQLNKELDRSLELLKSLEMDQMLEETKKELEKLAEKQEKLSEQTKDKKKSNDALKKKQDSLNKEFDDIKKQIEDIKKKNDELERPKDLDELGDDQKKVDQDQKQAGENLEKKKNKKASDSQKKASEKMQEMSQKMGKMQSRSSSQKKKEDMDDLRQLLENLVKLSVDQERLQNAFTSTSESSPKYTQYTHEQRDLIDDAKMVEDSLYALSKRVAQLSSIINEEMSKINMNLNKVVDFMQNRETSNLAKRQQYVMKGYNQLALMLSEVLQQMQKQQSMSMPGTGMCEKPGGSSPKGKPGKMSLKQMKQQLKQQLENMKKGKKPGGQKPGPSKGKKGKKNGKGQPKPGKNGMSSEQMVKTIQQQQAIRDALQKMRNKNGKGKGKVGEELQKMIDDINKNKEDMLNKDFQELIKRQQDILTRLLKNEDALREREFSKKRKSEEGKNKENGNPNSFLEYKKRKEKEIELLRTVPPNFKRYYKEKANAYVNTMTDG